MRVEIPGDNVDHEAQMRDVLAAARADREAIKKLRAALSDCAVWMDFREKMTPGIERLTERARRILAETE